MSGAVLFCHSVYLVRSPLLTTWSAFSVHRRAMVSPLESDGMLRSQASVCASTSASISCGPSAQSCTSKSSAVVLFAEEGGRHAYDSIMLLPAAGRMVACVARCGRQGPVLPPPVAPHGQEWTHRRHDSCEQSRGAAPRQAKGGGFGVGDVNVPPITQNNTSSPRNFALSARRFARVRPAAFHRNAESRRKPAAHQRVHPSSASRPPAPPLHCAAFCKRTQAEEKRTAASSTSRGRGAVALPRPLGASATGRASRHALFTHRETHHRHRQQPHRGTLRSQINHTKTQEYIPSGSQPRAPTAR
ncbi:hypothetical protein TCSYLVIO_001793 [Trypanosoma cruzi]|nr:hypothetical protein TCSYLVIO_001793 [Trypanosoma cruzi]